MVDTAAKVSASCACVTRLMPGPSSPAAYRRQCGLDGLPTAAASATSDGRRVAEREGFEPPCRLPDKTLSRRPRYDHFGTSPFITTLGAKPLAARSRPPPAA